jgi:hypothetical protein
VGRRLERLPGILLGGGDGLLVEDDLGRHHAGEARVGQQRCDVPLEREPAPGDPCLHCAAFAFGERGPDREHREIVQQLPLGAQGIGPRRGGRPAAAAEAARCRGVEEREQQDPA